MLSHCSSQGESGAGGLNPKPAYLTQPTSTDQPVNRQDCPILPIQACEVINKLCRWYQVDSLLICMNKKQALMIHVNTRSSQSTSYTGKLTRYFHYSHIQRTGNITETIMNGNVAHYYSMGKCLTNNDSIPKKIPHSLQLYIG